MALGDFQFLAYGIIRTPMCPYQLKHILDTYALSLLLSLSCL